MFVENCFPCCDGTGGNECFAFACNGGDCVGWIERSGDAEAGEEVNCGRSSFVALDLAVSVCHRGELRKR